MGKQELEDVMENPQLEYTPEDMALDVGTLFARAKAANEKSAAEEEEGKFAALAMQKLEGHTTFNLVATGREFCWLMASAICTFAEASGIPTSEVVSEILNVCGAIVAEMANSKKPLIISPEKHRVKPN